MDVDTIKVAWQVMAVIFLAVLLVDLWPVNRELVTFAPKSYHTSLFEPDPVVKKIEKEVR